MTPADRETETARRLRDESGHSRLSPQRRRAMQTTVTRDSAVIDLTPWARRYVALVASLLDTEAMDRAG